MTKIVKKGRPVDAGKIEKILVVASEQFSARGYRAVTMREVADMAGVAIRTLYKHYADKDSLFQACVEANSRVFSIPQTKAESIQENLIDFSSAFLTHLSNSTSQHAFLLVIREGGDFPQLRNIIKHQISAYFLRPLAKMLRAAGLEDARSTQRSSLFLMMLSSDWADRLMFGEAAMSARETEKHIELVVDIFLRGVTPISK
jgi:TetR/AcrR family transcriptional regulator, mexJK operon transcriptional repressor